MPATPEQSGRARDGGGSRPRRLTAEGLFFPLAAFYGSLAVPLSVQGMLGPGPPLLPGFASVQAHDHELLFGYALAVVAGFLVTRASRLRLMVLAAV